MPRNISDVPSNFAYVIGGPPGARTVWQNGEASNANIAVVKDLDTDGVQPGPVLQPGSLILANDGTRWTVDRNLRYIQHETNVITQNCLIVTDTQGVLRFFQRPGLREQFGRPDVPWLPRDPRLPASSFPFSGPSQDDTLVFRFLDEAYAWLRLWRIAPGVTVTLQLGRTQIRSAEVLDPMIFDHPQGSQIVLTGGIVPGSVLEPPQSQDMGQLVQWTGSNWNGCTLELVTLANPVYSGPYFQVQTVLNLRNIRVLGPLEIINTSAIDLFALSVGTQVQIDGQVLLVCGFNFAFSMSPQSTLTEAPGSSPTLYVYNHRQAFNCFMSHVALSNTYLQVRRGGLGVFNAASFHALRVVLRSNQYTALEATRSLISMVRYAATFQERGHLIRCGSTWIISNECFVTAPQSVITSPIATVSTITVADSSIFRLDTGAGILSTVQSMAGAQAFSVLENSGAICVFNGPTQQLGDTFAGRNCLVYLIRAQTAKVESFFRSRSILVQCNNAALNAIPASNTKGNVLSYTVVA